MKAVILFLPILMLACTKNAAESSDKFRIPWPDANQNYYLQDVHIESFNEPQYLRGSVAEFYVEPGLDFDEGRISQPGTPNGRFVSTQTGSLLALNTASLEAATVYAHIERLKKLDAISGADQFTSKRLNVGIEVNVETEDNKLIDNNAEYNPAVDSLLFMPYTDTGLPIPYNAGVIGHEYFHSIFQHLVLQGMGSTPSSLAKLLAEPLGEPKSPIDASDTSAPAGFTSDPPTISIDDYNKFLIRGINEGLADYWGWLYSGDADFVNRSIAAVKTTRKLSRDDLQFYNLSSFQKNLSLAKDDNYRLALSYALGSQYAVYFHNLTLSLFNGKSDVDTRNKMARILILALTKFKNDDLQTKLTAAYLAPEIFIKSFVTSLQESSDAPNLAAVDFCASFKKVAPYAEKTSFLDSCAVQK